ncbi:MAG: glutathione S-transferase N-terminal domain-containing protein [bacterium]
MGVVSKRSSMTFFSDPSCHYSHRVRIVLAEKGVTVDIEDVNASRVPQEVLELNPYGSLPTLVDRDLALYDTKVMMEYLDERFPHPPLLPVYPVARALSRQYMVRIEKDWSQKVDLIVNKPETKGAANALKDFSESIVAVAPLFAEYPYFMSEEFTLVDCCIAPLLWRLPSLGIDIPSTRQTKPLLAYMGRLFDRPSFRESLTERETEMVA